MSNGLAIAAVTSTLRYVLDRALQHAHPGPVGGARVTTLRPDRLAEPHVVDGPCLNVFLYQVTANHAWNLTDLPTRAPDGALVRRPMAALDLHYLITGHGDDESLDAQRLLGRAVTALAVTPLLTRDVVADAMDAYATEQATAFLSDADLADQVELVKVAPATMSLEELSRLWSVLLQTPYLLSLTYTATVVLIEADLSPREVLPVRQAAVTVTASGPPRLAEVLTTPPGGVVTTGSTVQLRGSDLLGPRTLVRIGPSTLPLGAGATATAGQVMIDESVPAGLHRLQVLHRSRPDAGGGPERTLSASNALPVQVQPTVTVTGVTAGAVTLTVDPPLFAGQRATVGLQSAPGAAPARTVSVQLTPVARGAEPLATLELNRAAVPAGTWLVRVQVDGVESALQLVGETYGAPQLVLP